MPLPPDYIVCSSLSTTLFTTGYESSIIAIWCSKLINFQSLHHEYNFLSKNFFELQEWQFWNAGEWQTILKPICKLENWMPAKLPKISVILHLANRGSCLMEWHVGPLKGKNVINVSRTTRFSHVNEAQAESSSCKQRSKQKSNSIHKSLFCSWLRKNNPFLNHPLAASVTWE